MTDIILLLQLTSARTRFPRALETVLLLFDITCFFSIGYIGEVC